MSLRVIIAAGGTGGHIFPGIAVARELQRRDPGVEVVFVGTARGLEVRVVPKEGFDLQLIDITGLKRVGLANMIRSLVLLPRSLLQARTILKRFQPDVVIGVGGYASGPILLMAALGRRPAMVIEPNAYPGLTNRVLSRWVRAAAVGFPDAVPYFHGKAVVTGNPVRPEFVQLSSQEPDSSRSPRAGAHVLIFGGSQGSHAINVASFSALPILLHKYSLLTVTHQTGEHDLAAARATYEALECRDRIEAVSFIHPLARELARADFVICRAGAITLAELAAAGKPALLVPLPTAADDHQRKNAEALSQRGAARCIVQSDLVPERLVEEVSRLIEDPSLLEQMRQAMRHLAHVDAAEKIVDMVYRIVGLRREDPGQRSTHQDTRSTPPPAVRFQGVHRVEAL